jgi:hypothetical protein
MALRRSVRVENSPRIVPNFGYTAGCQWKIWELQDVRAPSTKFQGQPWVWSMAGRSPFETRMRKRYFSDCTNITALRSICYMSGRPSSTHTEYQVTSRSDSSHCGTIRTYPESPWLYSIGGTCFPLTPFAKTSGQRRTLQALPIEKSSMPKAPSIGGANELKSSLYVSFANRGAAKANGP